MKRLFLTLLLLAGISFTLSAQDVYVTEGRFCAGDDPAWADPGFDDSAWQILSLEKDWSAQGVTLTNGFGWYRLHVVIPSSLKKGVTDKLLLDLGPIDDTDETFLNGVRVGKTGRDGTDPAGFYEMWEEPRRYIVEPGLVKWDGENVIAVRVYNGAQEGGFYDGAARIGKPVLSDFVTLNVERSLNSFEAVFSSLTKTQGTLEVVVEDVFTNKETSHETRTVRLSPKKETRLGWIPGKNTRVRVVYRDSRFGEELVQSFCMPYILTPKAPATPRYNGPLVFGVRPGSPLIFRLAFSGERPMVFDAEGLPEGVVFNPETGVLGGSVSEAGDYPVVFTATNALGSASVEFTLKVGESIALTPPMGWNSWNCWGTSVSQEKVMASAAALVNRGLADYGYSYINIDDAWEADERAADGSILTNSKFPDMRALGDWLHSRGLRLGIYSSPGDLTCGGYLGTLDHEAQDAATWNEWGVDYLKYDWCGYSKVFNAQNDHSTASYVRPYLKMQEYLRQQPRDIFYSLCQYGMAEVWTWGHAVDANSWRTTGDIMDTWESVRTIGFALQKELYPYAGPGHWNDPDMLVVGKVGWGERLHDSRLTPDEQYSHISLWSLLASNMLIGCPIDQIDDFTFNLLCNNEVNAVNQDILGRQARCLVEEDGFQIWARELSDGGTAVGIFNLNEDAAPVDLAGCLAKIGIEGVDTVRDLWRQQDIPMGTYVIAPHGVRYVKVR